MRHKTADEPAIVRMSGLEPSATAGLVTAASVTSAAHAQSPKEHEAQAVSSLRGPQSHGKADMLGATATTALYYAALFAIATAAVLEAEPKPSTTQQHTAQLHAQQQQTLQLQQQVDDEHTQQQQDGPCTDQDKFLHQQQQLSTAWKLPMQRLWQARKQAPAPMLCGVTPVQADSNPQLQHEDSCLSSAGVTAPHCSMSARNLLESLQQAQRRPASFTPHTLSQTQPAPQSSAQLSLLAQQDWVSAQRQEVEQLKQQLQQQAQDLELLQDSRDAAAAQQKQVLQEREQQLHAQEQALQQEASTVREDLAAERKQFREHKQEYTTGMLLQRAKLDLQHQRLQDWQRKLAKQQRDLSTGQQELQDQWLLLVHERAAWRHSQERNSMAVQHRAGSAPQRTGRPAAQTAPGAGQDQAQQEAHAAGAATPGRHGSRALPTGLVLQLSQLGEQVSNAQLQPSREATEGGFSIC